MDKEIIMGCCEPMLGPIEAYYTKFTIDRKLEEITSAITSGCCITPEEVDEKILSAKTEIEGEIPTVPTKVSAFENDVPYLTEHQSLSGYATEAFVSGYTYDKNTIDEKVAQGGTFDPTQYFNTAQTINLVESAVTRVEGEIPTVPTNISAFNNDAGYITGVDLSNYATKDNLTAATDDMATKTWVGQQGYLTEHQSLTAYSTTQEVNTMISQSVSGKQDILVSGTSIKTINNESLLGSGNITIQGGGTDAPISAGTGTEAIVENFTGNTASGNYSNAEGYMTSASGYASHAEGFYTETKNYGEHASGMYNVSHTGSYTKDQTLFSVGNGDTNTKRNAFEIRKNDDIYIRKNGNVVKLQDITPGIWCGTMAEYQEISGSTDNNTIYLIHS